MGVAPDAQRNRRLPYSALGLLPLAILLVTTGCHRAAPAPAAKVVEVVATTPITDDVTDYQDFTGRLDSRLTVDVRPHVSGYVDEAFTKEGQIVKKGDTLFQIDPRPFKADVAKAKADLKLAEADVVLQTKRAERGKQLIRSASGAISPEDYDQLVAARDKAIATVGSMKAALARAELYLEYTHVTSPLTGRVSRRQVDPGNLVNADQTVLTTIVTEDPMYVYFDVDERTYLDLVAMTSPGNSSWMSSLHFPVLMRLANEEEFTRKGYVNFLDNRLNGNTGTVRMRGVFDNPSGVLKSGLFARVRLPIGLPYKTLLIPDEALQSDQGRKNVFVVTKETNDQGKEVDKVKYRAVTLGQSIQGLRVIKEGLAEGERVIVSGMQRVRDGAIVEAKMDKPPEAPKSSLTRLLADNRATTTANDKPVAAPRLKDLPRLDAKEGHGQSKGHP
jgi:RND family efflux transporter MFP subunit